MPSMSMAEGDDYVALECYNIYSYGGGRIVRAHRQLHRLVNLLVEKSHCSGNGEEIAIRSLYLALSDIIKRNSSSIVSNNWAKQRMIWEGLVYEEGDETVIVKLHSVEAIEEMCDEMERSIEERKQNDCLPF